LRASGGKKAIAAAVNKKRREDPNPNRKGSADMVSNKVKKTNESKLFESEQRMKKAYIELSKELLNPNTNDIRREAIQRQIIELQQLAKRFGINLQKDSLQTFVENFECPHCHGLMYSESMITEEGKKDACYHKVKSRYKIWPSAYASGALVKCRKAGASNWGNKSKKNEDVEKDEEDSNIPGLTYKEIFGVGKPRVENLPFGQVTHRTTLRTPADAKILFVKRLMQKYDLDQRKATDIMKAVEYDVAKGATWDWAVENQLNIFNIADPFAGEREQEYNADQDRVRQQTVKTLKNFYKLVKQKQGQERAQAIARLRQIWNQGTPEEQAEADRMFGDDPQWQQIKSKLVMKPQSTNVELDESLKNKLAAAGVAATMALSPAHARVTDGGQSFAQQTAQQSSQHQSVKIPKQIPSKSYLQNVASGKSRSLMDPDTAKELLKKYYK
jgi:hypothetical protein